MYHLLPMRHVCIQVRIKFSAPVYLLHYYLKCLSTTLYLSTSFIPALNKNEHTNRKQIHEKYACLYSVFSDAVTLLLFR